MNAVLEIRQLCKQAILVSNSYRVYRRARRFLFLAFLFGVDVFIVTLTAAAEVHNRISCYYEKKLEIAFPCIY